MIRAFADDVGMVFDDIDRDLPKVIDIFDTFAKYTSLQVSPHKTYLIPVNGISDTNLNTINGAM